MENYVKQNDEERKMLDILITKEEKLYAKLNEEQREVLKNYEDCLGEISSISEKEAFIEGIRFATAYLMEALYRD